MASTTFDVHAAGYDSVAESALGQELRARVWSVLSDVTAPGDTVVDLGCGTGLDVAWLAPQVRSVQAFDVSGEMVTAARARCDDFETVTVHQGDAASLLLNEPVDVVLGNFGVVNCVGDLVEFGDQLHRLLTPGGYAVLVSMARWCPIELVVAAVSRNRQLLGRRRNRHEPAGNAPLSPTPGCSRADDYGDLQVRYASAHDLRAAFGSRFELVRSESLGLLLPPFEQRAWVQDRTRLRKTLATADRRLATLGARLGLGDHHIAVFKRVR